MSWKPLDQVYLQYAAGLNVSKLPRQRIIGEEMYNIKYKKEGESEYKNIDVHEDQFRKALRYIQTGPSTFKSVIESLQESGLSKGQIKEVIEIVYRYDDPHLFFDAVLNKMPLNDFLSAPNNDLITLITGRYNLEKDLVVDLLSYLPGHMPQFGRGEIFIILFVDNARKATRGGDIDVNGLQLEIKGSGARIVGTKGFGQSPVAKDIFTQELTRIIEKVKDKKDSIIGILNTIDMNNLNFDINVKSNGIIDRIAPALISTGKVTVDDIAHMYAKGLKGIYREADIESDLLSWIVPSLTSQGTLNSNFRNNYFLFAAKYYADQEDFNYLISIGVSPKDSKRLHGKFNFVSVEELKSMSPTVLQKIEPVKRPSFEGEGKLNDAIFAIRPVIS
jgi:hypothetical protein